MKDQIFKTALYDLHLAKGGRMVEFAGYMMPLQFEGIVAEHNQTRTAASLFDVSHMGQVAVTGPSDAETVAALEKLLPADIAGLKPGEMCYSVLLNQNGTIEDDLIISRPPAGAAAKGTFWIVVNAARKAHDLALLQEHADPEISFQLDDSKSLIALQGPKAAEVLASLCDAPQNLAFMQCAEVEMLGQRAIVSRSGYTGEDGFEISLENEHATSLAEKLTDSQDVRPAGLGARDSLRLEAGLCLYGHDLSDQTDPVSAGLIFAIGKARRENCDFLGGAHVQETLKSPPNLKRVGIKFEGRMPVREGAEIVLSDENNIGVVTSGTFSPTLQSPIAMAYLPRGLELGARVFARVRNKLIPGQIVKMPFVPTQYRRQPGVN